MSLVVQFANASLCSTCNSAAEVDRTWGAAGRDVRSSLSLLAECVDLETYNRLPNVSPEGDASVYRGASAAVILRLRPVGPPPGVVIRAIDVRELGVAG